MNYEIQYFTSYKNYSILIMVLKSYSKELVCSNEVDVEKSSLTSTNLNSVEPIPWGKWLIWGQGQESFFCNSHQEAQKHHHRDVQDMQGVRVPMSRTGHTITM